MNRMLLATAVTGLVAASLPSHARSRRQLQISSSERGKSSRSKKSVAMRSAIRSANRWPVTLLSRPTDFGC